MWMSYLIPWLNLGQYPKEYSDTVTMLEKVGHFLDSENQRLV